MSPEICKNLMGGVGAKAEYLAPVVAAALKDSQGGSAADIFQRFLDFLKILQLL
jgi:hypothetical protein